MTSPINVGLIGFGNIGTGVVNALNSNAAVLEEHLGAHVRITRIVDVDTNRKRDAQYDQAILSNDLDGLMSDPEISIVIELMGGLEPARTYVERALRAKKYVVTANKAMLATFGADLWKLAAENGVALMFEASVGGGIPIIRALQFGLAANRIRRVYGIVNGTCNYILTQMSGEKRDFEAVLAEAQAHGFAEPDPTYDIQGYDTAHKTAILASIAFHQDVRYADVFVKGITRIRQVDLEYASELGYAIKLLGIAREAEDGRLEVRVHPTLLPKHSLLANVSGVFNAVMVDGDLVGQTMFYGRGAGANPTSSAVLGDVMTIATEIVRGAGSGKHLAVKVGEKNLKPIGELETTYYVRLTVADRPGVMARISTILGLHDISINSMIQKSHHPSHAAVLIILTHKTVERSIQAALKEIAELDVSFDRPFLLRVEDEL